jgi:large conductance mechanosensitive channel
MPALKDFVKFIREQGVIGLAIGFILGGAVGKTVSSFVQDIIQPLLGYILGSTAGLKSMHLGSVMIGSFLANLIDFVIIASVVFYLFKRLKLDKLDSPKQ